MNFGDTCGSGMLAGLLITAAVLASSHAAAAAVASAIAAGIIREESTRHTRHIGFEGALKRDWKSMIRDRADEP